MKKTQFQPPATTTSAARIASSAGSAWPPTSRHIRPSIALENIDRWLTLGRVHPVPLLEWRDRIHAAQNSPEALRDLVAFLAAPNHDSERIKSCSPFAGLSCLNPTE